MNGAAAGILAVCVASLALPVASPAAAGDAATDAGLTAEQIVERNTAARGGLDAWRKIQTMIWSGHIESARAPSASMPFILEMKRPNQMRFDIKVQGLPSTRIYDGAHGWKLRPTGSGKPELMPYTAEELSFAKDAEGLDGPLMDYHAKGVSVVLDGMDEVEGRKAFRLNVRLPSGATRRVWIDASTFLETKYDREVRNALGQVGRVSVFYRDYKAIEGLRMPFAIETGTIETGSGGKPGANEEGGVQQGGKAVASDKMVIDRVVLNPALPDATFAKPGMIERGNRALVDIAPSPRGLAVPPGFPRLNRPGAPRTSIPGSAMPGPAMHHFGAVPAP